MEKFTKEELKIGFKIKAHGEGGHIYTLICIDETENKVAIKREKDGLVLTYKIDLFLQKLFKYSNKI